MDILKKFFPTAFKANDVKTLIISLIIFSKKYKIYGEFKQEVLRTVSEK